MQDKPRDLDSFIVKVILENHPQLQPWFHVAQHRITHMSRLQSVEKKMSSKTVSYKKQVKLLESLFDSTWGAHFFILPSFITLPDNMDAQRQRDFDERMKIYDRYLRYSQIVSFSAVGNDLPAEVVSILTQYFGYHTNSSTLNNVYSSSCETL